MRYPASWPDLRRWGGTERVWDDLRAQSARLARGIEAAAALATAARAVAADGDDLNGLLATIERNAVVVLGADDALVWLVEPESGAMVLRRTSILADPAADARLGAKIAFDAFICEAVSNRRSCFTDHFEKDPRIDPAARALLQHVRASLTVPLFAGNELVGGLTVHWTRPHQADSDEIVMADALGDLAAVAIRMARQLDTTRQARDEAVALLEATRRVTASLDLQETLDSIADEAVRLAEADLVRVAIALSDDSAWQILTAHGPLAPAAAKHRDKAAVSGTLLGLTLQTNQTVRCEDFAAASDVPNGSTARALGARSGIAIPLRIGDRIVGGFGAMSLQPRHFTPDRQRLLEALACSATLAVAQAQEIELRRTAEERLRHVLRGNPAVIYSCVPEPPFQTTFVSENVCDLVGYDPRDFLDGSSFWARHLHPDDAAMAISALDRLLADDHLLNEYRFQRADGAYVWMRDEMRVLRDDAGAPYEIVGVWTDVSAQKAIEVDRDRILALSPDLLCSFTSDGRFVQLNPAWERLLGFTIEELTALPLIDFVHPDDRTATQAALNRLFAGAELHGFVNRYRRTDGTYRRIRWRATPVLEHDLIYASGQDVTDIWAAAEEQDRLQEALARAEERERIAMDLHDGAVQMLFGLSLQIDAAERRMDTGTSPIRDAVAEVRHGINRSIVQLRDYISDLRTQPEQSTQTLRDRLTRLVEAQVNAARTRITLHVDPRAEAALSPDAADQVVYATYEAVSNAARHSGARSVAIRLVRHSHHIVLTVRDDGSGFDPRAVHHGMGLMNMQRRADELGGTLRITQPKERGTLVRLTVPLNQAVGTDSEPGERQPSARRGSAAT